MTTLPPHLEALGDDLSRAAARRVRELRRRRRAAQTVAAALSALVLTGAGLAASGVGIFGWLADGDETEARFSVSTDLTYTGPSPETISCSTVTGAEFTCTAGEGGKRTYGHMFDTSAPPFASREDLEGQLAELERAGSIDPALAAKVRQQMDAVSDDFFARLALMSQFQSVSASAGDERGELLPPEGVPRFAVCARADAGRLACRNLRGAANVPLGAPVYGLEVTPDWRVRPAGEEPVPDPAGYNQVFLEVFGRPLTPAEVQLLTTISTPAGTGSSGAGEVQTATEVTATAPSP